MRKLAWLIEEWPIATLLVLLLGLSAVLTHFLGPLWAQR